MVTFFVGGAYLVTENDRFQEAVYGNHGIKNKKGKFEFIFQNSDFILAIPRLYLTILIRKINSSFSLLSLYPTLLASLRMDKIAIVELNRVIKSEIRDIKLHLREKKSQKRIVRQNR